MWVFDLESLAFLDVNEAALVQYGYSRKEFLRMTIKDIQPENEIPALSDLDSGGVPGTGEPREWRHRKKNGGLIEVAATAYDIDWAGRRARLILAMDISERKRAQERASQLASIVESSGDAIIGSDLEGIILTWNAGAERVYGYTAAEAIGRPVTMLVAPDRHEEITRILVGLRRGERVEDYETIRLRKGGLRINVSVTVSPVKDASGKIVGVSAIGRDLTERKRAEERFHKAFNANPAPITIASISDGRYIDVNESFLRLTGYRREEVIGRTSLELKFWERPEDRAKLVDLLEKQASVRDLEITFHTKSGEQRTALDSADIIEIDGQKCIIAFLTDITERKNLENQLRQAQKMEAIGRLSGGIAHDFNNLLSVILGYSDDLHEQLVDKPALRRKAEEIKKAGRRAATLTRQLLAFSRQQVLNPKVLDLNEVVVDVEKMLQRLIGEDIELSVKLDRSLGSVKADQGQIEQVIINLVVNARDAMPTGGRVMIETSNVDLDDDYARKHPPVTPGSYILLAVSDTGTGMDAETQAHIFEPFFTTKDLGKGTGLGLATTYGVVKQSGGFIWVYSELGNGTTFKIYLPRTGKDLRAEKPAVGLVKSLRGTETILLVEDEEALRELTHEMLVTSGYTVLKAESPARALEIVRGFAGPIHLLLSDVVMPGMSGPDLAEILVCQSPETRVLYMSGYTSHSVNLRGLVESEAVTLQKPFTRELLLRQVRNLLEHELVSNPR
jgi:two-component system, cell cycle sensor histidine kinase and response regulator CckA